MTANDSATRTRELYARCFGEVPGGMPVVLASAPGRVELAGNHTDHQGGCTISAAIDRRAAAFAAQNGTDEIRVVMEGFGDFRMSCDELAPRDEEQGGPAALVRGMAAACARAGIALHGFDAAICSDVPVGAGVSSSAAFEVLCGAVMHALFGGTQEKAVGEMGEAPALDVPGGDAGERWLPVALDPTALALAGVDAERRYFGKPCGAQDQMACAHGGIALLDFASAVPRIERLDFSPTTCGYEAVLVDSACDHSAYTAEFAAIPADMHAVARHFGCERLGEVEPAAFFQALPETLRALGDRRVLRALHFFGEKRRVAEQAEALRSGDFERFCRLVSASGASSAEFLQNVSPRSEPDGARQPAAVVLALCAHLLHETGAYRIHGGGFGGAALAFVPRNAEEGFVAQMNALLGREACMRVEIGGAGVRAWRRG